MPQIAGDAHTRRSFDLGTNPRGELENISQESNMPEKSHPTAEEILELEDWNWPSPRVHEIARELCLAVGAAERYEETLTDRDPLRLMDATGLWQRACELAEALRGLQSGPLPPLVEDALAKVDAASDVRMVSSEPSG